MDLLHVHFELIGLAPPGPEVGLQVLLLLVGDRGKDLLATERADFGLQFDVVVRMFLLVHRLQVGLVGGTDRALPVIREILYFGSGLYPGNRTPVPGVVLKNITDIAPVPDHAVTAVYAVILRTGYNKMA